MRFRLAQPRFLAHLLVLLLVWTASASAAAAGAGSPRPRMASKATASKSTPGKSSRRKPSRIVRGVPTFADSAAEDAAEYDDPVVRQAAVSALGRYNGSVVAIDPNTGRLLTVVNQKLAFSDGFIPCSTIKPVIGLAALEQNVITRDTMLRVSRRSYMNLTEAMAHSNNPFFEELGRRMGFPTVQRFARLVGLGELAGYNIPEEHPGALPLEPPRRGGVARMSSFGEGIQITPLQLGALATALANGGTLYYLQYPRSEEERQSFAPRVKRNLNIEPLLPELREGMLAAVLYGTGRSSYDPNGDLALGKTGTCSDTKSRLGWFVSYTDWMRPRIVLVVLLRGNSRRVKGGTAAEVAGRMYRYLHAHSYFARNAEPAEAENTSFFAGSRPD